MEKILRVIESDSYIVTIAYYVAYNERKQTFDNFGRHDPITKGFTDKEIVNLKNAYEKIGIKHGIDVKVDVFNINEIDKYPLPNIGTAIN